MISFVTGTRNRPNAFRRLVQSICENALLDWELIAADASDEPMSTWGFSERVRIYREWPRLGCTKGYNRAFREARGEWVIWLNDDCEIESGCAENAIAFMERHSQIGLGALHYSENGGPFHCNQAWGCLYANFGILRRELGDKIGWFDDSLEMYGCDNSLTFRVLLAGKGVADIPDARVLHHSEQDDNRRENQANRLRDNQTLQRKYMPERHAWLATYKRLLPAESQTQPWNHGQRPQWETRATR